jgi:hypothetical protein
MYINNKCRNTAMSMTNTAGLLAVGELLVKGMYAAQPDFSSCSQEQLLQLLLLADRYGVPKVLQAVSSAFARISTSELQWQMLHAVYALPAGCADMDSCKGVYAAVGEKLQQELGDLELVWDDYSDVKPELLLSLPQPALLQLLKDPRTRVASENTVFFTINQWLSGQTAEQQQDEGQLRQLLQHVRMTVRCRQVIIAHAMPCNARGTFTRSSRHFTHTLQEPWQFSHMCAVEACKPCRKLGGQSC